jgi:hypothetical protein
MTLGVCAPRGGRSVATMAAECMARSDCGAFNIGMDDEHYCLKNMKYPVWSARLTYMTGVCQGTYVRGALHAP